MNIFDIIILSLLVFAFIRGILKGFVMGLSGLIGIILSIYIAKYFSVPLIRFVKSLCGINPEISPAVAFIIVFLVALLLFHFIAVLIDKLICLIALGWLNKLLGGMLSFLKYLFIMSVFLNVFDAINKNFEIITPETIQKSKLYLPVKKVVPKTLPFLQLDDLLRYFSEEVKDN
ncbi:MAG: CvpA family protein [Prevotellaceae bacterium]|jgi:membrane protein required for colicin V production|nr:CvpA family protein [Prevotellaceae bacterium]